MYIALVTCSESVGSKILAKHSVTLQEVREAVQWPARPTRARWVADDERGNRLRVDGTTARGRALLVMLYPTAEDGIWRLATAIAI